MHVRAILLKTFFNAAGLSRRVVKRQAVQFGRVLTDQKLWTDRRPLYFVPMPVRIEAKKLVLEQSFDPVYRHAPTVFEVLHWGDFSVLRDAVLHSGSVLNPDPNPKSFVCYFRRETAAGDVSPHTDGDEFAYTIRVPLKPAFNAKLVLHPSNQTFSDDQVVIMDSHIGHSVKQTQPLFFGSSERLTLLMLSKKNS